MSHVQNAHMSTVNKGFCKDYQTVDSSDVLAWDVYSRIEL